MKYLLLSLLPLFLSSSDCKVTAKEDTQKVVYICTGSYAKRYHSNKYCSGLNRCRGEIKAVPLSRAKAQGRTDCRKC